MSARTETVRNRIQQLLREAPFRSFVLNMENGDRVVVEHPENIAFFPGEGGSPDFYAITGQLWSYGTFDAVTSVARGRDGRSNGDELAQT